jgi:hypothetical protein
LHALLYHPAVQAALAPFLVALLTAEVLQRLRLSGLAIIAGFAITVYLLSGLPYTLHGSTHKIVWLGIASGLLAIPLSLANWSLWRPMLMVLGAAAVVWVVQRALLQHSTATAMQWAAGCALYTGWLIYWMDDLQESPVRAASAGMALGLGTAAALLIAGASLLGKYDLAIGSAAFAYLFIMVVSNSLLPCGRSFTLPLSLIAAMSGCLALLSVNLPWYTLAILAAIPVVAKLPVSDRSPVWVQATLLSCAALLCAFGAAYVSWSIHGWAAF